jgi:hypothetical protein
MSNRGSWLLLLSLALAGQAKIVSAQAAALQVQVYDYTGFRPAALTELVTRTQKILTGAGISVEVDACPIGVSTPCEGRLGSLRQVELRVIAKAPKDDKNARWRELGRSIATHDGGTFATVYLDLVEDEASEIDLPRIVVLSYAAAHEVGHLLLGADAHTSEGLMKAHWKTEDLQAMAQNRFHFTPEQAQQLKLRFGTPRPAGTVTGTSVAANQ